MTEYNQTADSRRSFMAKGALATGALALGTTTFGTATAGAQLEQIAVFANNYYPETRFDVIAPLQTNTTVEILQAEGETVPEISRPDEWNGYIIRYDIGDVQEAGITTFLFARGRNLSVGDDWMLGSDATMLTSELSLLRTSVTEATDAGPDPIEEDETSEFEEATEDEAESETNGGD